MSTFPILGTQLNGDLPRFICALDPSGRATALRVVGLCRLPRLGRFYSSIFSIVGERRMPGLIVSIEGGGKKSDTKISVLLSCLSRSTCALCVGASLGVDSCSGQCGRRGRPRACRRVGGLPSNSLFTVQSSFMRKGQSGTSVCGKSIAMLMGRSACSKTSAFTSTVGGSRTKGILNRANYPAMCFNGCVSFALPGSQLRCCVSLGGFCRWRNVGALFAARWRKMSRGLFFVGGRRFGVSSILLYNRF